MAFFKDASIGITSAIDKTSAVLNGYPFVWDGSIIKVKEVLNFISFFIALIFLGISLYLLVNKLWIEPKKNEQMNLKKMDIGIFAGSLFLFLCFITSLGGFIISEIIEWSIN